MPEAKTTYSFDALISYPLAKYICSICHFSFLTANAITVARLIPASIFFWTYLQEDYFYLSFISIVIAIFMGCIDGAYARMYNQCSDFGKILNNRVTVFIHTVAYVLVVYKKEYYGIVGFLALDTIKRYPIY
jgi:phosphatidylglycerophosphate synthase